MTLERCIKCGEPTGNAGKTEDSLYLDDKWETGPFCEECYDEEVKLMERPPT